MKPIEFGMQHDTWRPGQEPAIEWAIKSDNPYLMLEAPTGSGKTAIARAAAHELGKSIGLVRTKSLQKENYAEGYGFDTVFGRANYGCAYNVNVGADECAFSSNMKACSFYDNCEYILAREAAKVSPLASLNYAYYFLMKKRWPIPEFLILDEAHQVIDIILDHAGIEISMKRKSAWDLPTPPMIVSASSYGSSNGNGTKPIDKAKNYLVKCRTSLAGTLRTLEQDAPFNKQSKNKLRSCELFDKSIAATLEAISLSTEDDWFIASGPGAVNGDFGFTIKPLTAQNIFSKYFSPESKILLMSATLGDMGEFAKELGINPDFHTVPPIFSSEQQPVYALDVPRMGYKSPDSYKQKQVSEIARGIKICPGNWAGIVHTTSYVAAKYIYNELGKLGLRDRVFMNRTRGTQNQIDEWNYHRDNNVGAILISPTFHEGYDGTKERINICAKVPYPNTGSEFERRRKKRNEKMYLWRAASGLQQMMGRVRRGRPEDYDTPDKMATYNAIADGNWNWVKTYFSPDFLKCIVRE